MLADKIRKQMVAALNDFDMLAPHDKVMVAVSGGKDSAVLLKMFCDIKGKAPFPFTFEAVMLDQKQPGFNGEAFTAWVKALGVPFTMLEKDTYSIVIDKVPEGKTYCGLCSRLRRGILYNHATEKGFTKLALGHHRDDANETLLLNMFYTGALASMPPKLLSDDGRNVVIRPLCYVAEDDLTAYAPTLNVPIIPCNLCGSQENMQRKRMKQMLSDMAKTNPNVANSLIKAQSNIKPSQLFDANAWDFKGLIGTNGSLVRAGATAVATPTAAPLVATPTAAPHAATPTAAPHAATPTAAPLVAAAQPAKVWDNWSYQI